jgi:Glycosyl hydrolase family 99
VRLRTLLVPAVAALLFASTAAAGPYNPLRIAAYYPWFPEGWSHVGTSPFTHYTPSLGWYDAGDTAAIRSHIRAMRWGRIRAATYSWWGQGSQTDGRLAMHLEAAAQQRFRFAVYYELEGYGDPSVEELRADLTYLRETYARAPGYLTLGGKFVVFVYGDADDGVGCDVANRWHAASEGLDAYVVLKAFNGFRACVPQPAGWHAYTANKYESNLAPFSYSIAPGFYFAKDDRPLRPRDLRTWRRSVRRMSRTPAQFHFVISFNEWGEGTAIESAQQWASRSGYGHYLDVLHGVR